jgi:hypothetical protein
MARKKQKPKEEHVDLGFIPHKHQMEFFLGWKQFNILACTRRFGKSVIGCMKLTDSCLELVASGRKKQPKFAYIAPMKDQARQITWPVFKEFLAPLVQRKVITIRDAEMEVYFKDSNGKPWGQIKLYGTDKGGAEPIRGNYLDGVVLDELDSMDADDVWDEIVSPTLEDTDGWALLAGTIKGKSNIYNMIKNHKHDSDFNIGIYKFEDCWKDLPAYCDLIDGVWVPAQRKYERIHRRYKNKPKKFAREYQVDFNADGEDPLIPNDELSLSIGGHIRKSEYENSPKIIGIDVAGDGPDSHTICKRQGRATQPIKKLDNINEKGLANIVSAIIQSWQPDMVFVDHTGGYGTELISRLREDGCQHICPIRGVNFGSKAIDSEHYQNLRTEMYHKVRDWISDDGVLPDDEDLEQELSVLSAPEGLNGKAMLMKKDDIRQLINRSPDRADALALTFAGPVAPKNKSAYNNNNKVRTVASTGYNPFDDTRNNGYGVF